MLHRVMGYAVALLILALMAVPPARAGGSQEGGEQPQGGRSERTGANNAPQDAADGAGGEDAPAREGGNVEEPRDADNAVPQDLRNVLVEAGVQPLNSRIPSEDFTLPALNEGERSLASFKGDVVVINFWASWCGPCVQEMPGMQALYEDLEERNFTILAVNVQEQPSVVRRFIEENGYTFPVVQDASGRVAGRYGVRGLPTSYIMAPNGDLIGAKVGYHDWNTEAVRTAVAKILDQS